MDVSGFFFQKPGQPNPCFSMRVLTSNFDFNEFHDKSIHSFVCSLMSVCGALEKVQIFNSLEGLKIEI